MSFEKDILFMSKQCMFCNQLYTMIMKKNILNELMVVFIEDGYEFPKFITIVPSLLLVSGGYIEGAGVFEYIEKIEKIGS